MSAEPVPAECSAPAEWRFKDRTGVPRPFTGWFVDSVSTEREGVSRWTEMEVYRRIDGAYILRVVGCSDIYHEHNSECNTGEAVKGRDMDEDKVPCRRCRPGDYLDPVNDEHVYDIEVDIPSLQVAETPGKLIRAMQEDGNKNTGELSFPARRLLRKLQQKDPAIAKELDKAVPL